MAENRNQTRRRRRRRQGVSVLLTVMLMIAALLVGGMGGFIIARRTDTSVHALQAANERITELENTLTLIGFSENADEQGDWSFDGTVPEGGADDLAPVDAGGDDLWSDDSLLSGMLSENGEPVVVAEYDGGTLLSSEVIPAYNDALTDAVFSGRDASQAGDELLLSVMSDLICDKLAADKAKEMGLDALDADAQAQIAARAKEIYEARLADAFAFPDEETSEDDARAAAERQLADEDGVTLSSVEAELTREALRQRYFDAVVADVTIDDGEVQTYYDELLAKQKAAFSGAPEECEYRHNAGELIVYRPQDYRAVRDILIPFPTEQQRAEAVALMSQGEADDASREQADALYAPLEEKAAEAQEKLKSGQSFESLMDEYGCSEMLRTEPLRSEGIYLTGDDAAISREFVEAAMLLEQPGQVSSPARSEEGVHLVQYVADAPAGEVPLSDVEAAVRAEALAKKQSIAYDQQRDAMLEAANAKYYPERLH